MSSKIATEKSVLVQKWKRRELFRRLDLDLKALLPQGEFHHPVKKGGKKVASGTTT